MGAGVAGAGVGVGAAAPPLLGAGVAPLVGADVVACLVGAELAVVPAVAEPLPALPLASESASARGCEAGAVFGI